jgi:hypothetical protein
MAVKKLLSIAILVSATFACQGTRADSASPESPQAVKEKLVAQLCQLGLKQCADLSKTPARACLIDTRRCPPTARLWELGPNRPVSRRRGYYQ